MPDILTAEQTAAIRAMSERLGGSPVLNALAAGLGGAEAASAPPFGAGVEKTPRSAPINASADLAWSKANLRWKDEGPLLDLANVLRVLKRHTGFVGRYGFDKGMGKVLDRGEVMRAWQIDELAASLQERFLPGVSEVLVYKAVMIVANRAAPTAE